jgi:glycosyltransferase involved in cell wall biosynthesis
MRVLLTCKYLPPEMEGGGALTIHALATALAAEGVEVTILKARSADGPGPSSWPAFEVHETDYRDRFDYRARGLPDFYGHLAAKTFNHRSYRRALRKLVTPGRFDLIHAQNHTTALAAASLHDVLGVPLAATLRGHGLWCFVLGKRLPDGSPCSGCITSNQLPCLGTSATRPSPTVFPALGAMKAWMRYQDRLARRIDLMLPISTMMAAEAAAYDRPVRIIPDLVDDAPQSASATMPAHVAEVLAARAPGTHVALYAGRLAPNKGLDLVVDAAARAPEWLVLVAGEDRTGEYAEALRRRAAERNATNVRFLGWVPNTAMPAVYDAVDLVLLPFLRPEPLSRGMVEALSRGRALAATPHGGPLDGVVEGANGTFFEPTTEGLASALARLASADLAALGRQSRAIYEDRFRADRVVAAHLEAYEWLCAHHEVRR